MLRRAVTAGKQAGRSCQLLQHRALAQEEGQHFLQSIREPGVCGRHQHRSLSTSELQSESSLAGGDAGGEARGFVDGEGGPPGLSAAAVRRRSLRKTIPRPLSELERACIQMLWRRNLSEPIEVTLQRAQFPLTVPNLSLVLSHIRSAKDALRLFLCYIRANPSFVPEKALVDVLTRFWKHERERFPVFLSILNDLRNPSVSMTPRRLTTLLRGYGWAGLVDEVLRYLSSCEASYGFKPDFVHYSCAVHTCIEERRLDVALQIFDQMKKDDKPPTYDTFHSLISGLLTINQSKDAAVLFEQMLINQLVKPGELPCRVISYASIVNELLRSEDMRHAGPFLLKINRMGFMPDYFTCSYVLNAYISRGSVQEQHELYTEMKANGLLPDVDALKRFVADQGRGSITLATQKQLSALVTTLESAASLGMQNDAGSPKNTLQSDEVGGHESSVGMQSGCPPPSSDGAVVVVEGSASSVDMQSDCPPPSSDGAVVVVKGSASSVDMQSDCPPPSSDGADFVLFERIIYGLCVHEKPEDAFELMLRMVEDPGYSITPAESTSMILFDGLCWISKWEEAERILSMMMKWGHMPNLKVYNVWIQGSCKAGLLENVNDFLKEFGNSDLVLDAISHNALVEKFCRAGKLDEAKRITKEVKTNLGTLDVVSYSRMVQSFAKAGDFDVPRKLLTEMVEMGITPFALPFTPLVQRLCLAGKIDEALALVEEIEAKGCKPLSSQYTLLVSAYCKANRLQDAFNVMDIMKAKGVTPEPQTHKDLFSSCMGTRMLKPAVQGS